MESNYYRVITTPYATASIFSRLVHFWTVDVFKTGVKKSLKIEDLHGPTECDRSDLLGDALENEWKIEMEKDKISEYVKDKTTRKPSLLRALLRTFKLDLFNYILYGIGCDILLRLIVPGLVSVLLAYFNPKKDVPRSIGLSAAFAIAIVSWLTALVLSHYALAINRLGLRMRVAICSLVYRKSLRLSQTALGSTPPGTIVNMLAADVGRLELLFTYLNFLWVGPLAWVIVSGILYHIVGYKGLVGTLMITIIILLQTITSRMQGRLRRLSSMLADRRIGLMHQIISGIQVIKMYAWEVPFAKLVRKARKAELAVLHRTNILRSIMMALVSSSSRVLIFTTIFLMVFTGEVLTADKVFVIYQYFMILSEIALRGFARGIDETFDFYTSTERIQNFLMKEEISESNDNLSNDTLIMTLCFTRSRHVPPVVRQMGYGPGEAMHTLAENHGYMGHCRRCYLGLRNLFTRRLKDMGSKEVRGEGNRDADMSIQNVIEASSSEKNGPAIKIKGGNARWDKKSQAYSLRDINIEIPKGKLIGVVGSVGAGKSSFLHAILGELPIEGIIKVDGKLSYATQEVWVFGSTVRQNIIFGQDYDEKKYKSVVQACCLIRDFQQFSFGDQSLVGENGISLSGGQKARVNLARAIYRDADIYLLDDPLSAVDPHVAESLYRRCIRNYLRGKTVILVTHQFHMLQDADLIIVMKNGRIEVQGTFDSITASNAEYAGFLSSAVDVNGKENKVHDSRNAELKRSLSSMSERFEINFEPPQDFVAEKSSEGAVRGSLFWCYLRLAYSIPKLMLVVLLYVASQVVMSSYDYLISVWVRQETVRQYNSSLYNGTIAYNSSMNGLPLDTSTYSSIASTGVQLIISMYVLNLLRGIGHFIGCRNASQKLHDLMFESVIKSPMQFFDTTPSGRIINRFSKEIRSADDLLALILIISIQMLLAAMGSITLAVIINPYLIILVVVLGIFCWFIKKIFLASCLNIKRFQGITQSPVFTHLSSTLNGLSTIRVNKSQNILKREFDYLQDIHSGTYFMFYASTSAFSFLVDMACVVFITSVLFIFFIKDMGVTPDKVGLSITQALSLVYTLQLGMKQMAEAANLFMAVERIAEYINLPPEKGTKPDSSKNSLLIRTRFNKSLPNQLRLKEPAPSWPTNGRIEFKNVYLKYGSKETDPFVLNDLSFVIEAREKIGIVGRTGSGKSSLINAIFRLTQLTSGKISIDGCNIDEIYVENLRKKLSIIPQNPVLYNGTLKKNLDPFEEFCDEKLWLALEQVHLKDKVSADAGLDMEVLDGGANFSIGQRQLICLARALLRNNRLLMMDEATANVDPHTDTLIQETIRQKFVDCTVLTIAHRLNTIMDSDKVIVMDQGRILEFDNPYILLQNYNPKTKHNGPFRKMVLKTGADNYTILEQIAKDCWMKTKKVN